MNYLWTNGRLAIPAPAGLLVFIFKSLHSAVTEVENKENTSIHQPRVCTFTQLHAALFNFVETSTQMMTLLMLSKIASIINCLFISCEIVSLMPTSLKCCTLSTMTEQVLRRTFCKRAEDHLLGLHEVFIETSTERNVLVAKRPGGETSREGAKRPVT